MKILDLYKLHINPNPNGAEIHNLFKQFDLGIYIKHYNPKIEEDNQKYRNQCINLCKLYILENSKKLKINKIMSLTQEELQKKIDEGVVSLEYYPPSQSIEYYDNKENCYYSRGGNRLRDPEEYNQHSEGYTPFGDE